MVEKVFEAMGKVMTECKGGYAGIYLVNGVGLVGFRDPHGIRPMVFGSRKSPRFETKFDQNGVPSTPARMDKEHTLDYVMASESVAMDTLGFKLVR
jgi:amidophosphoribosyltransferase